MEQALSRAMVQPRPFAPHLATVVVSGWSNLTGASPFPRWERGHEPVSQRRALRLLNDNCFHQCPEVLVDCLFLGVGRHRKAAQKHCRSNDVLASSSKLWEIIPLVHDVVLDLTGVTPGATRRAMHMGQNMLYRMHRRRRRLVLPPLS